jgi:ATP-dependent DNA ligase
VAVWTIPGARSRVSSRRTTVVFALASDGILGRDKGPQWAYELKLDGYRAIAFKSKGRVHLRSRNDKDFA